VAENIITLSVADKVLTMDDYSHIIGPQENIDEMRIWQVRAGIIK
jgi:hypothetical protein